MGEEQCIYVEDKINGEKTIHNSPEPLMALSPSSPPLPLQSRHLSLLIYSMSLPGNQELNNVYIMLSVETRQAPITTYL
jgi:hypothetical protein